MKKQILKDYVLEIIGENKYKSIKVKVKKDYTFEVKVLMGNFIDLYFYTVKLQRRTEKKIYEKLSLFFDPKKFTIKVEVETNYKMITIKNTEGMLNPYRDYNLHENRFLNLP